MSVRTLTVRTPKNREKFLEALAKGSTVTIACRAAGMSRVAAYHWRKDDEDFAKAWDEAVEDGTDILEEEAKRRALVGAKKAVYQNGKFVGYVQEPSDTLMIFLLKGRRPEKFKDRVHAEHTGKDGGPIQHEVSARNELASRIAGIATRAREEEAPRVLN
jgi:hypothetical protein